MLDYPPAMHTALMLAADQEAALARYNRLEDDELRGEISSGTEVKYTGPEEDKPKPSPYDYDTSRYVKHKAALARTAGLTVEPTPEEQLRANQDAVRRLRDHRRGLRA